MKNKRSSARKKKTPKRRKTALRQLSTTKRIAKVASAPSADSARILAAVRKIPRGKVSTYGNIAEVAGLPRRARLVGTVLRQTPDSRGLPWYRVMNAGGRISLPAGSDAYARQKGRLEAEGVIFRGERVDLQRYGWPSRDAELDEFLWKPR
jgi:methylated-DNA-protein-cysteine methyltransferase related protein